MGESKTDLPGPAHDAMGERLRRSRVRAQEQQFLAAYRRVPDDEPELDDWVRVAAWPEE